MILLRKTFQPPALLSLQMSQDEQVFCTFSEPSWFYLKFWNAGREEQRALLLSLQWILGLWFRTSRQRAATSTAVEWVICVPGALTPEPQNPLWVFPHSPQSLSFPDWVSARYQEHWRWQCSGHWSQESPPNTPHRWNKRICCCFLFSSELHILTSLPF